MNPDISISGELSLPVPPSVADEGASSSSAAADAASSVPPPRLALPPRPPMNLAAAGGLGGGGLLAGRTLERKKAVEFTEHSLQSHASLGDSRSPTDRLRDLDAFRLHATLAEERERVGIPSSYERIDVTNLTHLLALCGGFVGVRFSSEDLSLLQSLTHRLQESFRVLEAQFKLLTPAQKKRKIAPTSTTSTTSTTTEESASSSNAEAPAVSADDAPVLSFHQLADAYLESCRALQELVVRKQSEIIRKDGHADLMVTSSDPDGIVGLSRPVWLEVLLVKYNRHLTDVLSKREKATTTASVNAAGVKVEVKKVNVAVDPINVGCFAAYISCLLVGELPVNGEENAAIFELLLASNDSTAFFSPLEADPVAFLRRHPQAYWASRVFVFLKKMSELKTAVKDDKMLNDFEFHLQFRKPRALFGKF